MARETYVMRHGRIVRKSSAAPFGPRVHVISDTMDATWHPATGERIDSKSRFRRVTKDAGCIEIGNESFAPRKFVPRLSKQERGEHIKRAIEQLERR